MLIIVLIAIPIVTLTYRNQNIFTEQATRKQELSIRQDLLSLHMSEEIDSLHNSQKEIKNKNDSILFIIRQHIQQDSMCQIEIKKLRKEMQKSNQLNQK